MTNWITSKFLPLFSTICIMSPTIILADCLGPPNEPILEIDIHSCEVATQFDNTLKITGSARQVLTLFYAHWTTSGSIELVPEEKAVSDQSFWSSVSPGEGCREFLQNTETLWLLGDVCNDTGQNIPDIQITRLWPEVKLAAVQRLAAPEREAEQHKPAPAND